MMMMIIILSQE